MGIGITGLSKAKLVPCTGAYDDDDGYDECAEKHTTVDPPGRGKGKDAVKEGCYVPGPGGRECSLDFSYIAYDGWIRRLSLMALGVEPREVWAHPRRYRGNPLVELITFPDAGGGVIGPITAARLYEDFVAFAPRARRYFATSKPNVFPAARPATRSAGDGSHGKRIGLANLSRLTRALFGSDLAWDEGEDLHWMWDSYRQFRRALRLAKNDGFVALY